ncbi:endonuclease [Streptomyces sp. NPDC051322]|uniref:endonuclease n=1 Tax=Streptomyces sp. NPDC051322 TaxID=3154645 RepID=UPI00344CCE26
MPTQRDTTRALLDTCGRTFAAEAGIGLRDTPQPLYRLLVLACLLSARIRSSVAVAAARDLSESGMRDARSMREATWQERVDSLGRGGYRRYDERTATQLGDGAQLVLDKYGGDLRKMRGEADGDVEHLRRLLQEVQGLGPAGANIFLREVQGIWTEAAPLLDAKALQGAAAVGLPEDARRLARLVDTETLPAFAAALVRVALDKKAAARVQEAASRR